MAGALSPSRAALIGRIGGLTTSSRTDGRERTQPARDAFQNRFLDEVDPEHTLPENERQRRAEALRRAYFARLAMLSAESRRSRKEAA